MGENRHGEEKIVGEIKMVWGMGGLFTHGSRREKTRLGMGTKQRRGMDEVEGLGTGRLLRWRCEIYLTYFRPTGKERGGHELARGGDLSGRKTEQGPALMWPQLVIIHQQGDSEEVD